MDIRESTIKKEKEKQIDKSDKDKTSIGDKDKDLIEKEEKEETSEIYKEEIKPKMKNIITNENIINKEGFKIKEVHDSIFHIPNELIMPYAINANIKQRAEK